MNPKIEFKHMKDSDLSKIEFKHMKDSDLLIDMCYFGKKNKTDKNLIDMGKLRNIKLGSPQQLKNEKAYVFGNNMCANFENHTPMLCNDDTEFMLSPPMTCPSIYQRGKQLFNNLSCTGSNCISDVVNGGKQRSRRYRKTKISRKTRRHRKTKKSRKYRK
jgi:hypothetical protein